MLLRFYIEGILGSERLRDLSKFTQLIVYWLIFEFISAHLYIQHLF